MAKKLNLIVWVIGVFLIIMVLTIPSVAKANTMSIKVDNPHGKFMSNTQMCGLCHNAIHRSSGARLLPDAVMRDFCYTCHGGAALGSDYNVELGNKNGVSADFLSGGAYGIAAEGKHLLQESNYPFGGTDSGGQQAGNVLLTCVSCHDPHGSNNFRNIKNTVNGVDLTTEPIKGEIQAAATNSVYGVVAETITYRQGVVKLCTACHTQYSFRSSNDPSLGDTRFRHPVNVVAFANPGNVTTNPALFPLEWPEGQVPGIDQTGKVVCLTCHFAHGSKIKNLIFANETPSGAVDGANNVFTTANPIVDGNYDGLVNKLDIDVTINSILQDENNYVLNGNSIEMVTPPTAGGQIKINYATYAPSTSGVNTPLGGNRLLRMPNYAVCETCHRK